MASIEKVLSNQSFSVMDTEKPVQDVRNDIYSLGVIGQQLLPESAYRGIRRRCQRSIGRRYERVELLREAIHRVSQRKQRRLKWSSTVLMGLLLIGLVFQTMYMRRQEAALKAELELQLKARQQLEERQRQQDEAKQRYDAIVQKGKQLLAVEIESLRQKKSAGGYTSEDWIRIYLVNCEYIDSVRSRLTDEELSTLEYALSLFLMDQLKPFM